MNETSKQNVGLKVKALRKERGLTQAELADLAGIHRTHVSYIEHGELNVSFDTLCKVIEAFGLSFEEFYKGM